MIMICYEYRICAQSQHPSDASVLTGDLRVKSMNGQVAGMNSSKAFHRQLTGIIIGISLHFHWHCIANSLACYRIKASLMFDRTSLLNGTIPYDSSSLERLALIGLIVIDSLWQYFIVNILSLFTNTSDCVLCLLFIGPSGNYSIGPRGNCFHWLSQHLILMIGYHNLIHGFIDHRYQCWRPVLLTGLCSSPPPLTPHFR